MADSTHVTDGCSVQSCDRMVGDKGARGFCPLHYRRWKNTGDPMGRKCETCGTYLALVLKNAGPRRWCSEDCRPMCAAPECTDRVKVEGYCNAHYQQYAKFGRVRPFAYRRSNKRASCIECGGQMGTFSSLSYCSSRCYVRGKRAGGARPKSYSCARCGVEVDLTAKTKSGRVKRIDSTMCLKCRKQTEFGMSVGEIARRDGTDCSICGGPVDMSLRRPESQWGPSVDHIIPRSKGGTDAPENLRLAHWYCNCVKFNREGFTLTT